MAVTVIDSAELPNGELPADRPLALRGPELTALADNYAELFAVVFAGGVDPAEAVAEWYAEGDEGDDGEAATAASVRRYTKRYTEALRLAREINTDSLAAATESGIAVEADDLAAALRAEGDHTAFDGDWPHPFPLVLLRTDYYPFAEADVPTGDYVVLLDPLTYATLLDSMARAGILELTVRGEAPDGPTDEPDPFVLSMVDMILTEVDGVLQTFVEELLAEVSGAENGPAWLAAALEAGGEEGASQDEIADAFLVTFIDSTGESPAAVEADDDAENYPVAAARLAALLLDARESQLKPAWGPGAASPSDVVAGAEFLVEYMAASLGGPAA